jgi:hypothetical protein
MSGSRSKREQYLLRIQQVVIQSFLLPDHSHVLVGRRVGVARGSTRLPAEKTIQVWTCKLHGSYYKLLEQAPSYYTHVAGQVGY